jgi:hypothetical protein
MMEQRQVKTSFDVLAKINNFVQVKGRIYKDTDGESWMITRYGFKRVEDDNKEVIIQNLREQLNMLLAQVAFLEKQKEHYVIEGKDNDVKERLIRARSVINGRDDVKTKLTSLKKILNAKV